MSRYTKNVQSLLTGGFKVLNVIFKSKVRVKTPRNFASLTTFIGVFPRRMLGSGEKKVLLMERNTDRLRGGELEAVLRHPLLNAVYTQLHSSLHSV